MSGAVSGAGRRVLSAATIFIGAFIAFAMEPLVGRTLLPEFGGMASVWVTCLAAFQVLLVGGYFYAHVAVRGGMATRKSLGVHLFLVAAGAAWLAFVGWRHAALTQAMASWGDPALCTLAAVLVLAGVPFVLLSANSSLVQVLAGGEFRLYAVSNLGSFAGLLAYPLVLEPYVSVTAQWQLLAGLSVLYALCLWGLGGGIARQPSGVQQAECVRPQLKRGVVALWLLIPAVTCFLLNATTAFLTSALTPVPLMWVYVLSLYLLTYVLGFTGRGSRLLPAWLALGVVAVAVAIYAMAVTGSGDRRFLWNFAAGTGLILFAGTGLHAWLYRLRPGGDGLTRYYLCLAVGGGVGGVLSSMVCPVVFKSAVEYPFALAAVLALTLAGLYHWLSSCGLEAIERIRARLAAGSPLRREKVLFWFGAASVALSVLGAVHVIRQHYAIRAHVIQEGRTFYGAWCVSLEDVVNQYGKKYPVYAFTHGGTTHGVQSRDEIRRREPTSYFGPLGGGLAFSSNPRYAAGKPVRVAVVGLGIGTLALYGRPGDTFRFFEICPEVMKLAEEGPFDYLRTCKAKREMVLGDARKRLEEEDRRGDEKYDILVMDAFSGDSISMYLVSQEAFSLYRRRLKDDGTFAVNITNWNLDLLPVMKAAARELGMTCDVAEQPPGLFTYTARWALMSRERPKFPDGARFIRLDSVPDVKLPTDERGSLVPYLLLLH